MKKTALGSGLLWLRQGILPLPFESHKIKEKRRLPQWAVLP